MYYVIHLRKVSILKVHTAIASKCIKYCKQFKTLNKCVLSMTCGAITENTEDIKGQQNETKLHSVTVF